MIMMLLYLGTYPNRKAINGSECTHITADFMAGVKFCPDEMHKPKIGYV